MSEYPDVKVDNSGPTGTPLRKQRIQNPGSKKTFTRQPIYLNPMQNGLRSLVTKDARRAWEAAVIVSPEWLYKKNMCPPNDNEHAPMKKMNVSVGQWLTSLSRAVNVLPGVENNYLDSLNIDLRNQFEDRYKLLTGETFAINSSYAKGLEAQLPMPKEMLRRARYKLIIDATFLKNVPIDNVLSDVIVMTIPLSRIPEMAEVVVTMFDPEVTGTYRKPPPKRVIFSNVLDHLACEGLMTRLSELKNRNPTTVQRTVVLNAAINLARAMEEAQQKMGSKLNTVSLFVTPPGFNQWPSALQRFVYLVMEVCQCRGVDFAICAPNMRVSGRDFLPSWISYMGYNASVLKILQSVETTGNSQLTLDDAIHFNHGTRMALLMFNTEGERRLPEPTIAECEAFRLHNRWSVRPPPVRKHP